MKNHIQKTKGGGVNVNIFSSFLSNEQVYFFFFQMNEVLVILKLSLKTLFS